MWYVQDAMIYNLLYEMIMFCWSYQQLAEALWLSLCCIKMQVPNNCFTLSLCDSNSCKSNNWRDDYVTTHWYRSRWWRSWCHAGDDDDHGAPKMKIKRSKMILAISCHYLIACNVYHVYASYLLRTTVVNKMIPHNNFKKVFPLTVRRCDSSLFRSTTWWLGVIDSNVHIQRV